MPGGRPSKAILNLEQLGELCHMHCTETEIEAVCLCDEYTLEKFVKENGYESFREFYDKHAADGKSSLRRRQYQKAMYGGEDGKGDASMLKWLGKQWLNQREMNSINLEEGLRKIIICNAEDEVDNGE